MWRLIYSVKHFWVMLLMWISCLLFVKHEWNCQNSTWLSVMEESSSYCPCSLSADFCRVGGRWKNCARASGPVQVCGSQHASVSSVEQRVVSFLFVAVASGVPDTVNGLSGFSIPGCLRSAACERMDLRCFGIIGFSESPYLSNDVVTVG